VAEPHNICRKKMCGLAVKSTFFAAEPHNICREKRCRLQKVRSTGIFIPESEYRRKNQKDIFRHIQRHSFVVFPDTPF